MDRVGPQFPLPSANSPSGSGSSGCDIDEFYSFANPLSASNVANYYFLTASLADLGPFYPTNTFQVGGFSDSQNQQRDYDPNPSTPCNPGGRPYFTNFTAAVAANGTFNISFAIQGGVEDYLYDVYRITNLNEVLDNDVWVWVGQGFTCNAYTFTNQPAGQAYFKIVEPSHSTIWAWGDNSYGECDVPENLTNAVSVAAGGYFSLALTTLGTVVAWGDDAHGQTNVPPRLTNVIGIAAGYLHGVAVLANGSVTNWGWYGDSGSNYCSVTNRSLAGAPPTSNAVAVAAGTYQDLALMSNGTVVAWGATGAYGTLVPSNLNLTNVSAISCGWGYNLALSSNKTITGWGYAVPSEGLEMTNVPTDLISNAAAIASGGWYNVTLRTNGTVEVWGDTNTLYPPPTGLSNVVAVATGGGGMLALQAPGNVVVWGDTNTAPGQPAPTNMLGVKAISGGYEHNLAISTAGLQPLAIQPPPPDDFALPGKNFTFSLSGVGTTNVTYQWQFDGTNIAGATNASYSITNAQAANDGTYTVVIANSSGSASRNAVLELAQAPQTNLASFGASSVVWINTNFTMTVAATNIGQFEYPPSYQWQLNGANIPGATGEAYSISNDFAAADGNYTVVITNAVGSTNVTWNVRLALPGMVENWGDNTEGESGRPVTLTNATSIAAGEFQSIAATDTGSVLQWGEYFDGTNLYSVTNASHVSHPPTNGVVSVAAGLGQALALMTNGTVRAWGISNVPGNSVPSNLSNVTAIACGSRYNLAISNGVVIAWGDNTYGQTNVPAGITDATAVAAGQAHALALLTNGTVKAWGETNYGATNVPVGLANVVAIAAGESFSLALCTNGGVVAWGLNNYGQTSVPAAASNNIMAIAAGDAFGLALKNDGTIVEWGVNTGGDASVPLWNTNTFLSGITPTLTTPQPIVTKLITAGGDHGMASVFSPLIQYPINISKDLLLIYNTNSLDSSNVWRYYLMNRPMVSAANYLGIGCTNGETIQPTDSTNSFTNLQAQLVTWLQSNPTKRPQYVVIFPQIPTRVSWITDAEYDFEETNTFPSVQYYFNQLTFTNWHPFVTSVNMDGATGTNNCIAYIKKLIAFASNSPSKLFISARAAGYGNTNWYFDDSNGGEGYGLGIESTTSILAADPSASVFYRSNNIFTSATNLAAYYSIGVHNGIWTSNNVWPTNTIVFSGTSAWSLMTTDESYSGLWEPTGTSCFTDWFASNSFGGTNYANTPVGAATHIDEPGKLEFDAPTYFTMWDSGKSLALCGWDAFYTAQNSLSAFTESTRFPQLVGDPFVKR